jgi:hypothetical protein
MAKSRFTPSRDEWRAMRRVAAEAAGIANVTMAPSYRQMLNDIKRVHGLRTQGMAIHFAWMRLAKGAATLTKYP